MKICICCNQSKNLENFYYSLSNKDNLMKKCKICTNKKNSIDRKNYYKEYKKQYNILNKEKLRIYNLEYIKNNKDYYKSYSKIYNNSYQKKKKEENILYKLSSNIRTRISQTIKGYSKSKSTLDILGVNNFEEFQHYIENKFQNGMDWSNYGFGEGKWVIDHIKPISMGRNEEEILLLNNHTNLQPLWWEENMIKSNHIIFI